MEADYSGVGLNRNVEIVPEAEVVGNLKEVGLYTSPQL